MILGLVLFAQISTSCAPGDSVDTLASVAKIESGFDTLAIHDNSGGVTFHPVSEREARDLANNLIVKRGHSVDLGLMQINSANLPRLGLSIGNVFDACHSITAGARILKDGYQRALRAALSRYNTGDPVRGVANGYVRRVELASASLPSLGSLPSTIDRKPLAAPVPAVPVVVLDMLHSNQVAAEPQDGPSNLLSGVAPSHAVEMSSQTTAAVPRPAT